MLLVDYRIQGLAEHCNMIHPFNKDQLNPSSYDICVGTTCLVETHEGFVERDLTTGTLVVAPGEFVLVSSLETFNLPMTVAAEFKLKSSRAREGWNHMLAGWCDPGWNGSVLTMELKNNLQYNPLFLFAGLRIGQMIFWETESPYRSYEGKYNNDRTVSKSKDV